MLIPLYPDDAKELIPEVAQAQVGASPQQIALHGSLGSLEAGHRVGTHARQEGWKCRRWLGRLHLVNGNQGAFWANQQKT